MVLGGSGVTPMGGQAQSGFLSSGEKYILAIAVMVVLGLGFSWYKAIHQEPDFTPQSLFEQVFVEAPNVVTNMEGDHNYNFGHDCWIKFRAAHPVHLKEEKEFKPFVSEAGRRWFVQKWDKDPALHDIASSYDYYVRTQQMGGHTVHEWFLIDKNVGWYYYRNYYM